jgi:hypothetical protein
MCVQAQWVAHSAMSDPAAFAPRAKDLPNDVAALNRIVQGVLIHCEMLSAYGLADRAASRQTLSVSERLKDVFARDASRIAEPRTPEKRSIGTCRDFALMLTSLLRCRGVPARLRCGFAAYFTDDWKQADMWQDHWVCEYWKPETASWHLSDAQLDDVSGRLLQIDFDDADMPRRWFKTAGEVWQHCRSGKTDPARYGHGETRGLWFIGVNVARDHLILHEKVPSPWDRWREASHAARSVDETEAVALDDLAANPEQPLRNLKPPWLAI